MIRHYIYTRIINGRNSRSRLCDGLCTDGIYRDIWENSQSKCKDCSKTLALADKLFPSVMDRVYSTPVAYLAKCGLNISNFLPKIEAARADNNQD